MNKHVTFKIDYFLIDSVEKGKTNEFVTLSPLNASLEKEVFFLHGHQIGNRPGAWEGVRLVMPLVEAGYKVAIPSLLGYGKTTGEPDYSGPATIKRLREIYDTCFQNKSVHVIGASRGAAAALLFANISPASCKTVTAVAGAYDLKMHYEESDDEHLRRNIKEEATLSEDALKVRSPLYNMADLTMPLMIVHGEEDVQISVRQATRFYETLQEEKKTVILKVLSGRGHKVLNHTTFIEYILPFIEKGS